MKWNNPETFALIMVSFLAFNFLLVIFIVWQIKKYIVNVKEDEKNLYLLKAAHQTDLATATVNSTERERERIAADIHDELVSKLRYILFKLENVEIENEIKNSIKIARDISHDLMPPLISSMPISSLIASVF